MGFSGGGSNVLKPHKHSSAVQDGSPLNMNNVTEATLSAGDVIYSDGAALQRLAIGTPAQQIKVNAGATAPEYFTPAAGASTWTEVINEYDNVAANTFDTGFVDLTAYRVLKLYWTGYLTTGTAAFGIRFYDPDGNIASGAVQATSGMVGATSYANGNQTSLDISFGQSLTSGRGISFGMEIQCSDVNRGAGGHTAGTFYLTQRQTYDAMYCTGNFVVVDGATAGGLMYANGFQEQSGNTYTGSMLTVLGMGDNTS